MENILGKRIELERTRLGMNQMELAKKLNLSSSASISQYENGDRTPNDDIKLRMCEIFGCSLDYLLGKSNIRNLEKLKLEKIKNVKYFNNKLNIDGLEEEDIEELQKQIDYLKWKKGKK